MLLRASYVLGLEIAAVGGEDEFGPRGGRLRARLQALQRFPRLPSRARGQMDIVDQQHRVGNIGLVGVALA